MTGDAQLPNKKDVARALLLQGTVFVHLDPRLPSVVVPGWLTDRPQLVLQIGLDMPIPIPDLRVDDAGVYGTLSFSRQAVTCSVPWEAVFAMVGDDGRGMVWPGSVPAEIAVEIEREARRGKNGKGLGPRAAPSLEPSSEHRPALEVVEGDKAAVSRSSNGRGARRPSYLRLVK